METYYNWLRDQLPLVCKGLCHVGCWMARFFSSFSDDYLNYRKLWGAILFILIILSNSIAQPESFIPSNPGASNNSSDKIKRKPSSTVAPTSVNVKDFGAKCDGVTDDTTAIQNAINSAPSLGTMEVVLPLGTCRITKTINLISNLTLRGLGRTATDAGGNPVPFSAIDASALTSGTALLGPGNATGITLENFILGGNLSSPVTGIDPGGFARSIIMRGILVGGFYTGIQLNHASEVTFESVASALNINRALSLIGVINFIDIRGGYANSFGPNSVNIAIDQDSFAVNFYESLADESFGVAAIRVISGHDISFNNMTVYSVAGHWGIILDPGASRVTLNNIRVEPFNLSAPPPVNTILINGSGHRLINVSTNPNGGGDIQDNAPDTVYINVNHKTLLSGGLQQLPVDPKPACDATSVGTTWFTPGASGVKDTYEICAKDAGNNYAWRTLY